METEQADEGQQHDEGGHNEDSKIPSQHPLGSQITPATRTAAGISQNRRATITASFEFHPVTLEKLLAISC